MDSAPFNLEPMTEVTVTDHNSESDGGGCSMAEAVSIAIGLPEGRISPVPVVGDDVVVENDSCYEVVEESVVESGDDAFETSVEVHVATTSSEGVIVDEAMVEIGGEPLHIDESSTVFTPPSKENYDTHKNGHLKPRIVLLGMRKLWQETLKNKGRILCPVPGCHMKFFTLFSFERHYRWCTGEKGEGVEKCNYCDGQFLSNNFGIVDHVSQDHPEKLREYKVAKRAAVKKKKVPPKPKKKDVVVYMNNSGNVDKIVSTVGETATVVTNVQQPLESGDAKVGDDGAESKASDGQKPRPCFTTKQFKIKKLGKEKKVKFLNKVTHFSGNRKGIEKGSNLKKRRPYSRAESDDEGEEMKPCLRKFPGTLKVSQQPQGFNVYSPKKKKLLGVVIEPSRNWSAPRRTYSRNALSSPDGDGGREENWLLIAGNTTTSDQHSNSNDRVSDAKVESVPPPPPPPELLEIHSEEDRFQLKAEHKVNTTLQFYVPEDEEEEEEEEEQDVDEEDELRQVAFEKNHQEFVQSSANVLDKPLLKKKRQVIFCMKNKQKFVKLAMGTPENDETQNKRPRKDARVQFKDAAVSPIGDLEANVLASNETPKENEVDESNKSEELPKVSENVEQNFLPVTPVNSEASAVEKQPSEVTNIKENSIQKNAVRTYARRPRKECSIVVLNDLEQNAQSPEPSLAQQQPDELPKKTPRTYERRKDSANNVSDLSKDKQNETAKNTPIPYVQPQPRKRGRPRKVPISIDNASTQTMDVVISEASAVCAEDETTEKNGQSVESVSAAGKEAVAVENETAKSKRGGRKRKILDSTSESSPPVKKQLLRKSTRSQGKVDEIVVDKCYEDAENVVPLLETGPSNNVKDVVHSVLNAVDELDKLVSGGNFGFGVLQNDPRDLVDLPNELPEHSEISSISREVMESVKDSVVRMENKDKRDPSEKKSNAIVTMREEGADEHALPLKKRRVETVANSPVAIDETPVETPQRKRGRPRKVVTPVEPSNVATADSASAELNAKTTPAEESAVETTPESKKQTRKTRRSFPKGSDLVCSACKTIFTNSNAIRNHIISQHDGRAKVNDDSPLTKEEENEGLRKTLKVKKHLSCPREECLKRFRSFMGYQMHVKDCGVQVEPIPCDICGKLLKPNSFAIHKKIHVRDEEKTKTPQIQNEDKAENSVGRRQASIRAKKRMEEFMQKETAPSDKAEAQRNNSDSDYKEQDSEHERKSEEEEPATRLFLPGKVLKNKLKAWEGKYAEPDTIREKADEDTLKRWSNELTELGEATCGIENCDRIFKGRDAVLRHWQRCGLHLHWRCLLCDFRGTELVISIWNHLVDMHAAEDVQQEMYSKTVEVSSYRYCTTFVPDTGERADFSLKKPPICFAPASKWTYSFYEENYSLEVFSEWKPLRDHWVIVENDADCLPPFKESVSFKMTKNKQNDEWRSLKLFESSDPKDGTGEGFFNVGGPVWSSDWCPEPLLATERQYVALDTCLDANGSHTLAGNRGERSLLQLWDLGLLHNNKLETQPRLALAVTIDYGVVWQMKWCPSGCWENPDDPSTENHLPRLGLLALACGDGLVRIHSIPHPQKLESYSGTRVYRNQPVVELALPEDRACSFCTSVSWLRTDGHRHLLSGYSNGFVCRWDLRTRSPLLVVRDEGPRVLRPTLVFSAHANMTVVGVQWCPTSKGKIIATAGFDRTIRFWDLEDLTTPYHEAKRGIFRDISWSCHWSGVFAAMDDGYNFGVTFSSYKEPGYFSYSMKRLSTHNACVWALSVSEWLNAEASVDSEGAVNLTLLSNMEQNLDSAKRLLMRRLPLYRIDLESLESSGAAETQTLENGEIMQPAEKTGGYRTYEDASRKYGLVFVDAPLRNASNLSEHKQTEQCENLNCSPPYQYHLSSVNTIVWSCNFGSRCWLFTAGQAGLARVSCLSALESARTVDNKR